MSIHECHQFTAGLCLQTLFTNKTDKCPLIHSTKSQSMFETSNYLVGFENEVLLQYSVLVKECNSKIKRLSWFLKEKVSLEKDEFSKILSRLIEQYPTCYTLVKKYRDLVKNRKYSVGLSSDVYVCKVCSALVKTNTKECNHYQHENFKKLREIREKLKKRVNEYEINIKKCIDKEK